MVAALLPLALLPLCFLLSLPLLHFVQVGSLVIPFQSDHEQCRTLPNETGCTESHRIKSMHLLLCYHISYKLRNYVFEMGTTSKFELQTQKQWTPKLAWTSQNSLNWIRRLVCKSKIIVTISMAHRFKHYVRHTRIITKLYNKCIIRVIVAYFIFWKKNARIFAYSIFSYAYPRTLARITRRDRDVSKTRLETISRRFFSPFSGCLLT